MTRQAITAAALAAGLSGLSAAEVATPRNVVIILSDDHRYDFMGFMRRAPAFLRTPSLDRMARGGLHVRNAFVTTSLCSPSRASILTGQYAHRHGVVDNSSPIPPGTVFFPQHLSAPATRRRTSASGTWARTRGVTNRVPASTTGSASAARAVRRSDAERERAELAVRGYTTDILTDSAVAWLTRRAAALARSRSS